MTWIETASYFFANYEIVKKFIKTKLKATSRAVQTLIDLVDNQKLEDEIFYSNDLTFLLKIIKGLEKQGLKKSEQMDLLNEAKVPTKRRSINKIE
jgi:hypothetical protein